MYRFLGFYCSELYEIDNTLTYSFVGNRDMVAKAFTRKIKLLIQIKHLITTQRIQVGAANAPPYVWMAAKHMESGHGIFSLEDKDLMKSLREAEMVV